MNENNYFKEIKTNGKVIQIENFKDGLMNGFVKILNEKTGEIYELAMKDNKMVGAMKIEKLKKIITIDNLETNEGINITQLNKGVEIKKTSIEKLENKKLNGKVIIKELIDGVDLSDAFFGNFVEGVLTGLFNKATDKEEINGNFQDGKKEGIFNIIKKKNHEIWEMNFINDKLDGKMSMKHTEELENKDTKLIKKNKFVSFLDSIKSLFTKIIKFIGGIFSKIKKIFSGVFKVIGDLLSFLSKK